MVRRLFRDYYSKWRGPPRIRLHLAGVRGRRFWKVVGANALDPQRGKYAEVLGTFAPRTRAGAASELRLRFSRVKFWLALNAQLTPITALWLGHAGLIPPPPPRFGRRTAGLQLRAQQDHDLAVQERMQQVRLWMRRGEMRVPAREGESEAAEPAEPAAAGGEDEQPPEGGAKRRRRYERRVIA